MTTQPSAAPVNPADAMACLQQVEAYHGAIDRGHATDGITCFSDDAHFQAHGHVHAGRGEILDFLTKREANAQRRTAHVVANPVTTAGPKGGIVLSALILLYALGEDGAYALENVLDTTHTFVRDGDTWLIAERTSRPLHAR